MSTAEILSLISTLSFVVAAISFVLAVFFWFNFKIPSVIGDLSGRTAKKSIARMRASNERAGGQGYKPSAANVSRGKLTDRMKYSSKLSGDPLTKKQQTRREKITGEDLMPETGLLATNDAVAADGQQTDLLVGFVSTYLLVDEDATVPIWEEPKAPATRTGGKKLTILDEVMLIHTDEMIG